MNKEAGYVASFGCLLYFVAFIALTVVAQGFFNHWWIAILFFVVGAWIWNRIYTWAEAPHQT